MRTLDRRASGALENGRYPLTSANAHRHQCEATPSSNQFVYCLRCEYGTRGANWVAQSNRSTVRIGLLAIERKPARYSYGLCRECLIAFDDIHHVQ